MSEPTLSTPFTDMAGRIERNGPVEFAGAAVIILPGGKTIEYLAIDPAKEKDPMQFLGAIKARCEIAANEIEQESNRNAPFGRR